MPGIRRSMLSWPIHFIHSLVKPFLWSVSRNILAFATFYSVNRMTERSTFQTGWSPHKLVRMRLLLHLGFRLTLSLSFAPSSIIS